MGGKKNRKKKNNSIEEQIAEVKDSVVAEATVTDEETPQNEAVTVDETNKEDKKDSSKKERKSKKRDKTEDKLAEKSGTEKNEADEEDSSVKETISEQEDASDEEVSDDEDISDSDAKPKKKKKKKAKKSEQKPEDVNIVKELLSLIVYIGIVVLLCYIIITYVGCRSRVDGNSMNPTLNNKDSLWVDKLSYTFGDPDRFDVIIFDYDEDTTYVKRVIGLPGETVRIDQKGQIFINEQLLVENYGLEPIKANNLGRANQPVLLGEDEYFVLGDNRNNSSDSRWADVGNVNKEDIVGKVICRIYPFKDFGFVK